MKKRSLQAAALGVALVVAGALLPSLRPQRSSASADPRTLAVSAMSYLHRSRSESRPALLTRAESLLERSLELQPTDNYEAFVGMASLSNARHEFASSVAWARRAIDVNPYGASPYGLLGDALFELGRYRQADDAYEQMNQVRPDLASYVRASYAFQFHKNMRAAIGALRLALQAAGTSRTDAAWVHHQLGDVYFRMGKLARAARANRIGTQIAPGYVPPRVGLAEVDIARGRYERAIRTFEEAVRQLPALEYIIRLGNLYRRTGQDAEAEAVYATARAKIESYYRHGVEPDVDFVLFYADRGIEPERTLERARAIYRQRPTGATADALAWTLHRLGRDTAAWRFAQEALRSPLRDATIERHAAAIEAAQSALRRSR